MRARHMMKTPSMLLSLAALGAALAAAGCASSQTRFDSPEAAATGAADAVRTDSVERLHEIFGPEASDLLSSGDEVADRNQREQFLAAYDERHAIERDAAGSATLVVGPNDWPFPVPLVRGDDGRWVFDTEAGLDEVVNRRVGRNELTTIETCRAIVDAQRDYAALSFDGKPEGEYARRFVSGAARDPHGPRDGLYWPTAEGEPLSPLGESVAAAHSEGYRLPAAGSDPQPYHGYVYRMLEAQGPYAPGGRADYVVDGRMTRGFAVIAWPVDYGNSGIMTFLVGANGIVYETDLGEGTALTAADMTEYDPDPRWTPSN